MLDYAIAAVLAAAASICFGFTLEIQSATYLTPPESPISCSAISADAVSQVQGPESSTVDSTGTDYITWLAAVATFAASVAGTWYTLTQGFSAKKEPATQDDDQLREPLVGAGEPSCDEPVQHSVTSGTTSL